MTPRQVDVAFVLESVAGVGAVFAIDPRLPAALHFDFAVETAMSGRVIAEAHYALLRVMSHDDCARVFMFSVSAPQIIAGAAQLLQLSDAQRAEARARVASPAPPGPIGPHVPPRGVRAPIGGSFANGLPTVLVVGIDDRVLATVHSIETEARWVVERGVASAVEHAALCTFDLILCDAPRAFGPEGLLAKLPLDVASRVVVLAEGHEVADARWRLQGTQRLLTKPLEAWVLRERLTRATAVDLLWAPDLVRATSRAASGRTLTAPPASAPFTVLLAGIDGEVHEALRRSVPEESRYVLRSDPDVASELAMSARFHLIVCSANRALHPRSLLDAIAREDPPGADRVLVVAPARDVPYVKHKLAQMQRKNTVLELPIDDARLTREIHRRQPALAARAAIAAVRDAETPCLARPRFRRLAVLVVDDDPTTHILFAASDRASSADVALATSAIEAFEHVTSSRGVELLLVSATMRSDGGEAFYRVLWRLQPDLKARCMLIVDPQQVPSCTPQSARPRLVERPLTREAIRRVVDAFGAGPAPEPE